MKFDGKNFWSHDANDKVTVILFFQAVIQTSAYLQRIRKYKKLNDILKVPCRGIL